MKIYNYKKFLLEWGYGGEGGVASKDPIKVKSSMITDINFEDDEDDEDEKDIPILQDILIKESNVDLKTLLGKKFVIISDTIEEYKKVLNVLNEYNIRWFTGEEANYKSHTIDRFHTYLYISESRNLTCSNRYFHEDGTAKYTAKEILKIDTEKRTIRWYNHGKLQKESDD